MRRLAPSALAALLALPAAGAAAPGDEPVLTPRTPAAPAVNAAGGEKVVDGVTFAPRVALRQDESFADPGVPDAALDAPVPAGDSFVEGSPSISGPAASHGRGSYTEGGVTFTPSVTRDDYRRAYHAVPYSRAEHLANPSYRHEAAMKFLTGEYPPAKPVRAAAPAIPAAPVGGFGFGPAAYGGYGGVGYGGGYGLGTFGVGVDRFGFGRGLGYGPAGIGGVSPAAFPGLITNGGVAGPSVYGPPPFAFDRIKGAVPTFVNRYRPPGVFLPAR